jgi:hypothetical protein
MKDKDIFRISAVEIEFLKHENTRGSSKIYVSLRMVKIYCPRNFNEIIG